MLRILALRRPSNMLPKLQEPKRVGLLQLLNARRRPHWRSRRRRMGRGVDVDVPARPRRLDAGLVVAAEGTLRSRRLTGAITIVSVPILITESTIGDW
jgi:hypothetical protein